MQGQDQPRLHAEPVTTQRTCKGSGSFLYCFAGFTGSRASGDWEHTLRGVVRVDNRLSSEPSKLTYKQATSGSTTVSIGGEIVLGTEGDIKTPSIQLASMKLQGQMNISGSGTWSWIRSDEIEDEWTIPPYKVGYTYCDLGHGFVEGATKHEVYHVYTGNFVGYEYRDTHGDPPSAGAYTYKHVIANS